ncbi:MAG: cytochrome c biogenesis protein CcsA [Chitinophagales bacterium]|jgi:heme exporter protein C|nr:cytochrome c biogenesis protein CcsA [Chitinophagales bacterium]MCC7058148.1 cytochrome c biogenesis protein CcsA [Chitinophagales bacterium]MDA0197257.1 cytochrome c biogenesis protein CcsA [Bacteroidota bacterium]
MESNMAKNWYKYASVILILYGIFAGFLSTPPRLPILNESIRNLYFHVPMWFAMIAIYATSAMYSTKYLRSQNLKHDLYANAATIVGNLLGWLGMFTGMLWARFTWGDWWNGDVKQIASLVALCIYLAYAILRNAIDDVDKRARIAAVYNLFAFPLLITLIFIVPRMYDSLHPGNGGNPAFGGYDLDHQMRLIFYPTIIGWIFMSFWLANIVWRWLVLENRQLFVAH